MTKDEAMEIAVASLRYEQESGYLILVFPIGARLDFVGKRAGCKYGDGYRYVRVNGFRLLEHRIIWRIVWSVDASQIDHVNGVKDDNRLANLREATNSQNCMNKTKQANNTSGYKGVYFNKSAGKFHARICKDGLNSSLGYYGNVHDAHMAYTKAQKEIHGSFAKL